MIYNNNLRSNGDCLQIIAMLQSTLAIAKQRIATNLKRNALKFMKRNTLAVHWLFQVPKIIQKGYMFVKRTTKNIFNVTHKFDFIVLLITAKCDV